MKMAAYTIIWTALVLLALGMPFLLTATTLLQYDRAAASAGQFWRVITCHWTHWSAGHLFWSGGAFVALAIACLRIAPRRGLVCVAISALTVGVAVSAGTDLSHYRGLSGVDSALFAMLATIGLMESLATRDRPRATAFAVLLLALAGKLAYECFTGRALFVHEEASNFSAVPLAHAAGAVTGALVAVITHKAVRHRSAAGLIRKMHCQPPPARG